MNLNLDQTTLVALVVARLLMKLDRASPDATFLMPRSAVSDALEQIGWKPEDIAFEDAVGVLVHEARSRCS